jgi:hypothetical protein
MANTKLDVFNLAMYHVGTREDIADINEVSREAEVCRLLYDRVYEHVLRSAYWSSCKAFRRLAVVKERNPNAIWIDGDPEPGFRFTYSVPDDYLYPRFLNDYGRFSAGAHAGATVLFTDSEQALLTYTKRQDNVALWDSNLFMAMTYALAAYATMPLNGKPGRAQNAAQQANNLIVEARVANANSEEVQLDTVPPWIAARGYTGNITSARFFYPFGPLVNAVAGIS